jgi:hypothetical protein
MLRRDVAAPLQARIDAGRKGPRDGQRTEQDLRLSEYHIITT